MNGTESARCADRCGLARLAVIVPVFHNAPSLPTLHERLRALEEQAPVELWIIYVEDRSGDDSFCVLEQIAETDDRACVVRLSRNHGSFLAIRAGLDYIGDSDCVATLGADLQDPPETLLNMLARWREGNDVVLAARGSRSDPAVTRLFAAIHYSLLRRFVPQMPGQGFDFFLVDRKVADVVRQFRERNTSLVALLLWLGYRRAIVHYERRARPFGRSMWTLRKKAAYFVDTLACVTAAPLRLASAAGVFLWLVTLALAGRALLAASDVTQVDWRLLAFTATSGLQFLCLGIVGEYVWRTLEESRARPLYTLDEVIGSPLSRSHRRPVAGRLPVRMDNEPGRGRHLHQVQPAAE